MANKSFRLNSIAPRMLIALTVIPCIVAVYYAAGWCFGSTLAQQAQTKEAAAVAIQLAPSDPQSYVRSALIDERTFLSEDLPKAMRNYEEAVALAPHDFRLWLALGKARERSGDSAGAEKALRKAAELAPNYAEVHWTLGNQLLRQGNDEEAFIEIRRAVEQNNDYANQAVNTAWQIFGGDVSQISQKIGDSAAIKAGLAPFLAKQGRFDEALTFWNALSAEEMSATYKKYGDEILAKLIEKKEYKKALGIYSQIYKSGEKFSAGNIFNGDFEREVKSANAAVFDWQIAAGQQPQIGLDKSQKRGGGQSLVLIFNSQNGQDFRAITQTVVVEGGKSYKFEAFYRSELKTSATVQWEIVDAADGKILATTQAAAATTADWSPLSANFTAPQATQAVIVRLSRAACQQTVCPISGKIWFDDLSLK